MNPFQMIQQFNQFKRSFKGNPEEEVKKLVASGKMSQQQLDSLQNMASQFQQMLKNFR